LGCKSGSRTDPNNRWLLILCAGESFAESALAESTGYPAIAWLSFELTDENQAFR